MVYPINYVKDRQALLTSDVNICHIYDRLSNRLTSGSFCIISQHLRVRSCHTAFFKLPIVSYFAASCEPSQINFQLKNDRVAPVHYS